MHTIELGLERAEDIDLLLLAEREDRIIVSADTDFGTLLALSGDTRPSINLFRSRNALTADQHAELILDNLDDITPDLVEGAVVVISDDRIRIRRLPFLHDT